MKLVATTVSRGVKQGDHGALYLIDTETENCTQIIKYADEIDYSGRGGDRGLRGIARYGDSVYVCAASKVLVMENALIINELEHPLLGYLHDIIVDEKGLMVVSTKYDCLLHYSFMLQRWDFGMYLDEHQNMMWFDPDRTTLSPNNKWHINSLSDDFVCGLRLNKTISLGSSQDINVPLGTHNHRLIKGVHFYCDTDTNTVVYGEKKYTFSKKSKYTFLRGVTWDSEHIIVGQTPASVHVFDYDLNLIKSINLPEPEASIQSLL